MPNNPELKLINDIKDEINRSTPPKIYWASSAVLPGEVINKIFQSPKALTAVQKELSSRTKYHQELLTQELLRNILNQFQKRITDQWGTITFTDIIKKYNLKNLPPKVDINLQQLLQNTNPQIVLNLGLSHLYPGVLWKSTIQYQHVKDVLDLFNINPRTMHYSFPNIPQRDEQEYISPKLLSNLWTSTNGGEYIVSVDINMTDYIQNPIHYHHGITLPQQTLIQIYDYPTGEISFPAPLLKNLTILHANIPYKFKDDSQIPGISLNIADKLNQKLWKNKIQPVATQHS